MEESIVPLNMNLVAYKITYYNFFVHLRLECLQKHKKSVDTYLDYSLKTLTFRLILDANSCIPDSSSESKEMILLDLMRSISIYFFIYS